MILLDDTIKIWALSPPKSKAPHKPSFLKKLILVTLVVLRLDISISRVDAQK